MGYFLVVPEQNASGASGISVEGIYTADCIINELADSSLAAGTIIVAGYGDSEEVADNTVADFGIYNTRECVSVERGSSVTGMDIGGGLTVINESGILTTNTNVLRFYGDTLYSGATVTKRSDATITTDGRIELDGGDDEPRPNTELIDGGSAENDNALIDGGDET